MRLLISSSFIYTSSDVVKKKTISFEMGKQLGGVLHRILHEAGTACLLFS